MKIVMLSPLPLERIRRFIADCRRVVICELNHEGQLANLLSAALGRPFERVTSVPGVPMPVGVVLDEIRRLAKSEGKTAAA